MRWSTELLLQGLSYIRALVSERGCQRGINILKLLAWPAQENAKSIEDTDLAAKKACSKF